MKFATLGSYLLDDIVRYGKDILKKDIFSVGRYTCINPISFCFSYKCTDDEADDFMLECENKYQRKMHRLDLRKTLLDEVKKVGPDLVLFDFSELFSPVKLYKINGKELAFTYHGYMKECRQRSEKEQILSHATLSFCDLMEYARAYVEKLIACFGKDKLVMVETQSCYQYFDKSGKWTVSANVSDLVAKNKLLNDVYLCIEREFDIEIVKLPELLINDLSFNMLGEFKLAEVYYRYLVDYIFALRQHKEIRSIEDNVIDSIEELIDSKIAFELAKQAKTNGIDKGKKLVLIGHSEKLEKILKEQYNAQISIRIAYFKTTKDEELYATTEKLHNKSKEYYLVIPHLYRNSKAIKVMLLRKYVLQPQVIAWPHPNYQIKNIIGYYCDIFNNKVESKYGNTVISVKGNGSYLYIGQLTRGGSVLLENYDQSNISIKDSVGILGNIGISAYWASVICVNELTTLGGNCFIIAYSCGVISIGKDCMFANEVTVVCGDGYAIYDVKTGKNLNSDPAQYEDKLKVIIDEHVWIGRGSFLINCRIGKGSIVGARSLVKNRFQNNCIVAGVPAKMIKKDIAWSRELNCYDIDDPFFGVPSDYRQSTKEND